MFKRTIFTAILISLFMINSTPCVFAGGNEPSREELVNRISSLEEELAQLKTLVNRVAGEQTKVEQKIDNINVTNGTSTTENAITSKHKVKLYGFLKLDASSDSFKTNNPDAPKYALSKTSNGNEKEFAMTAMNSRLGLKYYGPEELDAKVYGNLELDFYDTASDNSQKPRMRHAFFELQYPKWSLLAGQTWDIFGPLGPNTLNTNGYLWYSGNIGFRRPQIRLTKVSEVNDQKKVTSQLSINRNIGSNLGSVNTGEDSNHPMIEGRVAYAFPLFGKTSTVAIAGLWGREKSSTKISVWAGGLDFVVPLTSTLSVKGEFFRGANLDGLLAGIGQGVNTTTNRGIDSIGGWGQVTCKPWDKYAFNLGYGTDKDDKDDLNTGDRHRNSTVFANINYAIIKDVKLGLEYSYTETKYLNQKDGENNRITTSLIYSF
ncbi:MAG: porin [Candidatus Omnitrophica bacterium]|nr:porin [Candidatus Omnitrophota bacterium]